MQKEKAKSKRGVSIKKHSSAHNHRISIDKKKRKWSLYRKAKQSTTEPDSIHSITFENKAFLDVCSDDYQGQLVQIINDIYPDNKSELKNLKIKQETPGFILNAIFERLDKKHKYELFLVHEDKWIIRQKQCVGIDFHHLAIDDLIRYCDSDWSFIECLVYTISLLRSHCGIEYSEQKEYRLESLVDYFHSEEEEYDRKRTLKGIAEIRFGFFNHFNNCVQNFEITPKDYLKKIDKLKPACSSQVKLCNFFFEAYELINSGYSIDHFYNPYEEQDGYVNISQMIRFVWSLTDDPLNVSEELIDLANNSGWEEPTFYNDITETSKEIVIPDAFYKFIKLMNDARFNSP